MRTDTMSVRDLRSIYRAGLPSLFILFATGLLLLAALHRFRDSFCWHLWILVFPV